MNDMTKNDVLAIYCALIDSRNIGSSELESAVVKAVDNFNVIISNLNLKPETDTERLPKVQSTIVNSDEVKNKAKGIASGKIHAGIENDEYYEAWVKIFDAITEKIGFNVTAGNTNLENALDTINIFAQKIDNYEKLKEEFEVLNQSYKNDFISNQEIIKQLRNDISNTTNYNNLLKDEIHKLTQNKENQSQVDRIIVESSSTSKFDITSYEKDLETILKLHRTTVDQLKDKLIHAQNEIETQKSEAKELQGHLAAARAEIQVNNGFYGKLKESHDSALKEIESLRAKIKELEFQVEVNNKNYIEKKNLVNHQDITISELRRTIVGYKSESQKALSDIDLYQKRLLETQYKLDKLDAEQKDSKALISSLEENINSLTKQKDTLNNELTLERSRPTVWPEELTVEQIDNWCHDIYGKSGIPDLVAWQRYYSGLIKIMGGIPRQRTYEEACRKIESELPREALFIDCRDYFNTAVRLDIEDNL